MNGYSAKASRFAKDCIASKRVSRMKGATTIVRCIMRRPGSTATVGRSAAIKRSSIALPCLNTRFRRARCDLASVTTMRGEFCWRPAETAPTGSPWPSGLNQGPQKRQFPTPCYLPSKSMSASGLPTNPALCKWTMSSSQLRWMIRHSMRWGEPYLQRCLSLQVDFWSRR